MKTDIIETIANWSIFAWIFVVLFTVSFCIRLFFVFRFYWPFLLKKERFTYNTEALNKPVSVVICAKDEAKNLEKHLPAILEQEYPNFEVVVVNDCSEDDTEVLLEKLKEKYSNLRSTFIKKDLKFKHGKKLALTIGIKAAKHDLLLLTDADCMPVSKNWIKHMAGAFNETIEVVIGYGAYKENKGLLNKLIRYETLFNAVQYLSLAIAEKPYMGVGRNLAYRRSTFFNNKGFASHSHVLSGDDDLFVNEVANKVNSRIVDHQESFTISEPKKTFKEYFHQKRRHLLSGKKYKKQDKRILGFDYFGRSMFYLSAIVLVSLCICPIVVLSMLAIMWIISFLTIFKAQKRFNEKGTAGLVFIFDFFIPIIYFILVLVNLFVKKHKWK